MNAKPVGEHGLLRRVVTGAVLVGSVCLMGAAGAGVASADVGTASVPAPTIVKWGDWGSEIVTVPDGVNAVFVDAIGGSGGNAALSGAAKGGKGAEVRGLLHVTPGEQLVVMPGQQGVDGAQYDAPAAGGAGGMDANGGQGPNNSSDYLDNGGGGGGASTVQVWDTRSPSDGTPVIVAGGGGGAGGASGSGGGSGGNAGDSWSGADGQHGKGPKYGGHGRAGAGTSMAGVAGASGSGIGGNGGGGGGGYVGGGGGGHAGLTDGGGGGAAGSSYHSDDVTVSSIQNPSSAGDGIITLTWTNT